MKFSDSINILYVEDDDIDVQNLKRSFKKAGVKNPLFIAENGVVALEMLRGNQALCPQPRVVLLDINMPKMNGLEFLAEIRKDESLRRLLVFVLTTSDQERDLMAAYDSQVAGYIVKPVDVVGLTGAVERLKGILEQIQYPPH